MLKVFCHINDSRLTVMNVFIFSGSDDTCKRENSKYGNKHCVQVNE